jgi:hypothetical protein
VQKEHVGDDTFRKLVQDHAHGRERASKQAHVVGNGIDNAVDERMDADTEHRHDANARLNDVMALADEAAKKPVEEMHARKACKEQSGGLRVHRHGFGDEMQERGGDEHAGGIGDEVDDIRARPMLEAAHTEDTECRR